MYVTVIQYKRRIFFYFFGLLAISKSAGMYVTVSCVMSKGAPLWLELVVFFLGVKIFTQINVDMQVCE